MRLQFNAKTWVIEPLYRDDNSHLWQPEEPAQGLTLEIEAMLVKPERTEADGGDPHDEPDGGESERRLKPVPGELVQDKPQAATEFLRSAKYPEWDYLIGAARAQWCTVQEVQPAPGDPSAIDAILSRNEDLLGHLDRLVRAKQLRKPVRLRKQMDGDRFDLDAAVTATLDIRSRRTPDARFHERIDHRERDLSVLVLLDLSHSANDSVRGGNASVLQLTREATVLLAHTMEKIGDQFAIHGFCSNGRNEVRYRRFKDFGRPFDEEVKGRLAGMGAELSTRMGGAIRHATGWLKARRSERKLILLITDGEPHDIDVHDPRYLMFDAKKAVDEAARAGILTYCMSVDPDADRYVARIFGVRNYMVVDHIRCLPEKLPMLYLRLTH
jgi:nitric oxide reductase activation protein